MINYKSIILSILFLFLWITLLSQSYRTDIIDSLEQVLTTKNENDKEKTELMLRLSHSCKLVQDTTKAKMYAFKALELSKINNWIELEGNSYMAIGNFYMVKDQYYLCYSYYKEAEKIFIKIDARQRLTSTYQNLMLLFDSFGDFENSSQYAEKVIELAKEQDNQSTEILAQYFLGRALYQEDNGQEALNYNIKLFQKSLLNANNFTAFIAMGCGNILIKQKLPKEALWYLHWSRNYFETNNTGVTLNTYALLSQAYAMLNQIDSANFFMKKTLEFPIIYDDTRVILYVTQSLIDAYKNDYRSALKTYKLLHEFCDSIEKAEKFVEIARLKNWHQFELMDNENQILQHEHNKQHTLIIILSIALAMILVLLALSFYYYKKSSGKNRELKELHTVKDKLFSIISHDLRSPLSSLISTMELANNNFLDPETQAHLLDEMSNRVDNTNSLIENLLRWSKNQMHGIVPNPEHFDVHDEVKLVIDSVQVVADAKMIKIKNYFSNHKVFADRDMFSVVLRNLIMNAIKYTSPQGKIILKSELSENKLVISVKDNGTGMSQEVQNNIFKLSETKSKRGTSNESGTGLGLVLCADFVKINGGDIWFTSQEGKGSTFCFSVPV